MKPVFACLALLVCAPVALALDAVKPAPAVVDQPRVEIVFCIDNSGSMGGVIETAKKKVWTIVNEVAKAKPSPILRIGLIGYGQADRAFRTTELTSDLDEVYSKLMTFDSNFGGDEWVGLMIHKATTEMKWSDGKQVMKVIYVVGNETARQGPAQFDYAKTAPAAIAKGIMVNAIYCGDTEPSVIPTWRETAKLADGQFLQIAGDGGAVVIATPFDKELGELNSKLNTTYVAYGMRAKAGSSNQAQQDSNAAALAPAVLADRVASKATTQYSNAMWDLVDASKEKDFDLKKVKDDALPEEMRKLDEKGRKAYLEKKTGERADLQKSIKDLATKRDAFVRTETEKQSATGPKDSFDAAVRASLRKQAESKGFKFE